jgi:hypothetical protein
MRKFVVLGVEGERDLYLVDLVNMTVERSDGFDAIGADGDDPSSSGDAGQVIVKGVHCAVLAHSRPDAAYQRMSG